MNKNITLWILLLSGIGLIALGAMAIWAILVTQSLSPLAQTRVPFTFGAAPTAITAVQADPNAIGWSVGSQAPEIELKDLNDETVRLSDLRGKPVLVNFWATWCAPCRFEMPLMEKKYRAYKESEKFVILAVDVKDDSGVDAVRNFISELSLTFPVLLDSDGSAETAYHILGLPMSFFIDRRGVIRATRVGAMSEQYIDEQLQKIFAEGE